MWTSVLNSLHNFGTSNLFWTYYRLHITAIHRSCNAESKYIQATCFSLKQLPPFKRNDAWVCLWMAGAEEDMARASTSTNHSGPQEHVVKLHHCTPPTAWHMVWSWALAWYFALILNIVHPGVRCQISKNATGCHFDKNNGSMTTRPCQRLKTHTAAPLPHFSPEGRIFCLPVAHGK